MTRTISAFAATALAGSLLASCSGAPQHEPGVARLPTANITSDYNNGERLLLMSAVLDGTAISPTPGFSPREMESLKSAAGILNTGPRVFASDYLWQVGLRITYAPGMQQRCGGTLISKIYILTAAHCVDAEAPDSRRHVAVAIGAIEVFHGLDEFGASTSFRLDPASSVAFHPQWKKVPNALFAWDAALLKLAEPLAAATPAPVRKTAVRNEYAITSGWGNYNSSGSPSQWLRAVKVPVVGNNSCVSHLPSNYAARVGSFTLCAVSPTDDACTRDSGSPLVIGTLQRPQTIGIVSWGVDEWPCGVAGPAGVLVGAYTRTSEIAKWIEDSTGQPGTVTDKMPGPLFEIAPRDDTLLIVE
jgi:hypothetical protein